MPLDNITNAEFDAVAGAVPAPYGPLTRVTDMDTNVDYDYNSDVQIEVTSALSKTLYISYDEMNNVVTRDEILGRAHSGKDFNHLAYLMTLAVEVINEHAQSYAGPPYSDTEWKTLIGAFRYMGWLAVQAPDLAYFEIETDQIVKFDTLTLSDAGSNNGSLAIDIGGEWTIGIIDWENDGTVIELINAASLTTPITHDYGGIGAQTVRVVAIGPGGFAVGTSTATIT